MIDYRYTSLDNSVGWKVDATGDFVRDENGMKILDVWKYKDQYGIKIVEPDERGWNEFNNPQYVHSFEKFGLFPAKKPVISPAKAKINIIDVSGSSSSIDFTESLTGKIEYGRRTGDFRYVTFAPREHWDKIYMDLCNAIHGKRKWVLLDELPEYFLDGRLTVSNPEYKKDKMFITIKGDFEPYRKNINGTLDDWLWDPFNFETGFIPEKLRNISVPSGDTTTVLLNCNDVPSTFGILIDSATSLSFDDLVVKFKSAKPGSTYITHTIRCSDITARPRFEFYDFVTAEGNNELVFSCESCDVLVSLEYRTRSL